MTRDGVFLQGTGATERHRGHDNGCGDDAYCALSCQHGPDSSNTVFHLSLFPGVKQEHVGFIFLHL